ncbi:MAG: adenine deaminase, partial [Chloroflexota bacterium]
METGQPSGAGQPFDAVAWRRRLVAARGTGPADLILAGGHVVNVFSGEIERANVAIVGSRIAGVGDYALGHQVIDVAGSVIAPSFIDAHLHVESSLLWLPELARAVVPHGTGVIVTDPHEIANVAGIDGLRALRDAARGLPLHIRFTAPSCVPASDHESPGAQFGPDEIAEVLAWPETVGLGELMDYPAVIAGSASIAAKL